MSNYALTAALAAWRRLRDLCASACFVMGAIGLPSVADAATITWNPAEDVASALDIDTTGTLVEAINATGNVGASTTVNSVLFAATSALLNRSFGGDALDGHSSGDPALDALLGQFDYGTPTTHSIGDGLLVLGETYQIQVFFTDLRNCCAGRVMSFGDGAGNEVDLHASSGGLGQFAIGVFDADGTTQALSMSPNGFVSATITGYQIRAIPEPTTALLLGLGLVGLAARRCLSQPLRRSCESARIHRRRPPRLNCLSTV